MAYPAAMTSNNVLVRTVNHRGRTVIAMDCALANVGGRPVTKIVRRHGNHHGTV